ncbi:MAG: hypothetical protein ACKV0T_17450 [Planctomycetales bacterium]
MSDLAGLLLGFALLGADGDHHYGWFPYDFPWRSRLVAPHAGHIDLHPDGRRGLLALTYLGAVWEVDLQTGEVYWEYINTHAAHPLCRNRVHPAR